MTRLRSPYLTVQQAAAELGCSEARIYRLIRRGDLVLKRSQRMDPRPGQVKKIVRSSVDRVKAERKGRG